METGDWSYIIFLAVYGVDSVLTIIHRLMLHENIGLPHRKHMYQLMANELKIPHVVVGVYGGASRDSSGLSGYAGDALCLFGRKCCRIGDRVRVVYEKVFQVTLGREVI